MNIDCSALIGLGSCIEMSVFSSWKLVSDSRIKVSVLLMLVCYCCKSARTMNEKPISHIFELRIS